MGSGGGQGKHRGRGVSWRMSRTLPVDNGMFQAGKRACKKPSVGNIMAYGDGGNKARKL